MRTDHVYVFYRLFQAFSGGFFALIGQSAVEQIAEQLDVDLTAVRQTV